MKISQGAKIKRTWRQDWLYGFHLISRKVGKSIDHAIAELTKV